MYLACFLRLWMTSESALGAQTIILWHLRESGPEKQTTNNKKIPWQNTFAMFVFHYWCNPVVFLFLDQWKKILGFLKQLSHILWEYWNRRLYKQTGNGQFGGEHGKSELALIPQTQGRYGMHLGCKYALRNACGDIVTSWCLDFSSNNSC